MNNLIYAELKKFNSSKIKYSILVCFIPVFLITFIYAVNEKYPLIIWDDYLTTIQTFLNALVCPGAFGLITANIFASEFETKTINILFTYPFNRIKILISKFISIFLVIITTLLLAFLTALICGLLLKHEPLTFNIILSHFIDYLQLSLMHFMLTTIIAALTIRFKHLIPALIFIISMIFLNIILMNSSIGIVFPMSIPVVLTPHSFGGRSYTNYALGYSALCIYFIISSFLCFKNFKYIHE